MTYSIVTTTVSTDLLNYVLTKFSLRKSVCAYKIIIIIIIIIIFKYPW